MDMNQHKADTAEVIFPPLLIYLGTFIVGLGVYFLFPLGFVPGIGFQLGIGIPLILFAFILFVSAGLTMKKTGTTFKTWEPTTAIVMHGPFRFSRNPIYLANTILYIGIAISLNALWPLVLLPAALAVVIIGVIRREERYLERKFGQEYLRYKARVRRWF